MFHFLDQIKWIQKAWFSLRKRKNNWKAWCSFVLSGFKSFFTLLVFCYLKQKHRSSKPSIFLRKHKNNWKRDTLLLYSKSAMPFCFAYFTEFQSCSTRYSKFEKFEFLFWIGKNKWRAWCSIHLKAFLALLLFHYLKQNQESSKLRFILESRKTIKELDSLLPYSFYSIINVTDVSLAEI